MDMVCSKNLFCDDAEMCGGAKPHLECGECGNCPRDEYATCIPIKDLIYCEFCGRVVYVDEETYNRYKTRFIRLVDIESTKRA